MLTKPAIFFLIIAVIVSGCNTSTGSERIELNLEGVFEYEDLENREIYKLQSFQKELFAGTSKGFAALELTAYKLELSEIYMPASSVRTFIVIEDKYWLISAFDRQSDSERFYKSTDQGKTWISIGEDFGGKYDFGPTTMDAHPEKFTVLYGRYAGAAFVAKSTNGGKSWKSVYGNWNNPVLWSSYFVKANPYLPNQVWAGGASSILKPTLIASSDGGKGWSKFRVLKNIEASVHDIVFYPKRPKTFLVGLAGSVSGAHVVRKSTDGGQSWKTVYKGINTRTFTHSAQNHRIIYASGRNASGTLFFIASGDFGESWEKVIWEDSPPEIKVNDIVSVMQNGQEVLYFATNKGIYSYTFEK